MEACDIVRFVAWTERGRGIGGGGFAHTKFNWRGRSSPISSPEVTFGVSSACASSQPRTASYKEVPGMDRLDTWDCYCYC
ncbi:unnamed protein product, partial [Iphiclides podalirius]